MKNIYLTKKRLTGLIWSLLFGFSFSYLFDIHILNFWEKDIVYKLFSLLSLTIIFTCLCYLIVVNIIFPRVSSLDKFKLYQFIIVCCVFAAAFSAVLPLRSPLPPQWNNLKIIVPESEDKVSENGEVWLTYIVMNGDRKISFDSLRQTGSWKEENGYLIAKSGPASLEYRFRYREDTEINIEFLSHERGGKVIVQMENYEKHLDLLENPGGRRIQPPIPL